MASKREATKRIRPAVRCDVYRDSADEWRWRFWRGSRIVADSAESYTTETHAMRAVSGLLAALEVPQGKALVVFRNPTTGCAPGLPRVISRRVQEHRPGRFDVRELDLETVESLVRKNLPAIRRIVERKAPKRKATRRGARKR